MQMRGRADNRHTRHTKDQERHLPCRAAGDMIDRPQADRKTNRQRHRQSRRQRTKPRSRRAHYNSSPVLQRVQRRLGQKHRVLSAHKRESTHDGSGQTDVIRIWRAFVRSEVSRGARAKEEGGSERESESTGGERRESRDRRTAEARAESSRGDRERGTMGK